MKLEKFIGLALVLLGAYIAWSLTFGSPVTTGSGSGFPGFGGGSVGPTFGAGGDW